MISNKKSIYVVCVVLIVILVVYFIQQNEFNIVDEATESDLGLVTSTSTDLQVEIRNIRNSYNVKLTTDGTHVFLYGEKIDGLDPATTKILVDSVLVDKDAVYYIEGLSLRKIEGLRPDNIRVVTGNKSIVLANDTQVYTGIFPGFSIGKFTNIVSSPAKLRPLRNYPVKTDLLIDDVGLYMNTEQYFIRLPITSPEALYYSLYIKGVDNVYYDTKQISDADASSFRLINEHFQIDDESTRDTGVFYAKDSKHVYYKGDIVDNADPKTFAIFKSRYYEEYAYDREHVYFNGQMIDGADPESFIVLKNQPYEGCALGAYSKDARNVYYMADKIEGADPTTFQALFNGYGKDSVHSYLEGKLIDVPPGELKVVCYYG